MTPIVTDPKKLSTECEDVTSFEEAMEIVDKLNATIGPAHGIGLAANQIGINKKVFIIRVPEINIDETGQKHITFIGMHFANPQIVKLEEPIYFTGEGCLSFPGEQCETIRYNKVIVKDMLSPEGRTLTGLRAVVVQHETDHCYGITMHKRKRNAQTMNDPCPCKSGKKYKKCCLAHIKKAPF